MVKGIAKRVVVVRFSEEHLFEQAILLMRDGCDDVGVTEEQILREANELAAPYQREQMYAPMIARPRLTWAMRLFCAVGGAGLTAMLWLVLG